MKHKILPLKLFIAIFAAVIVGCVLLDQLTKLWIFDGLLKGSEGTSVNVLGKFLRFVAVYNAGAAFGMGKDEGANIIFFIVTIVGLPLFGFLLWRSRTRSLCGTIGYAFIIGGTIGNAIDRAFIHTTGKFFSGEVRDFISFSIFPPVFNIADSFLVIGVFMAIAAIVFLDFDGLIPLMREDSKKSKAAAAEDGEEPNSAPEAEAPAPDVDIAAQNEVPDEKN